MGVEKELTFVVGIGDSGDTDRVTSISEGGSIFIELESSLGTKIKCTQGNELVSLRHKPLPDPLLKFCPGH